MIERWRIYLYWKMGMNLVTFWIASAYSFNDAQQWVADNLQFTRNKKRGWLFKKLGSKRRIYSWDDWNEWADTDEGVSDAFLRGEDEQEPEPLALPAPILEQGELFHDVWVSQPKIKRRL